MLLQAKKKIMQWIWIHAELNVAAREQPRTEYAAALYCLCPK